MAPPPKLSVEQKIKLPPPTNTDLTGRIVIVTGSNVGLGFEAVKHLSTLNPEKLIIACRTVSKGEAAAEEVYKHNGGKLKPDVWKLDLSDLNQTKEFGDRCLKELPRLDIFMSNAGVYLMSAKEKTKDGYETCLQANGIANCMICTMLLPLMLKTAELPPPPGSKSPSFKPHLSITSSGLHFQVKDFPGEKEGNVIKALNEGKDSGMTRYNQSKAINALNVQTLANIAGPSVIINAGDPGFCKSNLGSSNGSLVDMLQGVMRWALKARSTEEGSRCLTWPVLNDTPTGCYSSSMAVTEASDYVISAKGRKTGDAIFEEMKQIWKEKTGLVV